MFFRAAKNCSAAAGTSFQGRWNVITGNNRRCGGNKLLKWQKTGKNDGIMVEKWRKRGGSGGKVVIKPPFPPLLNHLIYR